MKEHIYQHNDVVYLLTWQQLLPCDVILTAGYAANPMRYYSSDLRNLGLSPHDLFGFASRELATSAPVALRYLQEYPIIKAYSANTGLSYDRLCLAISRMNLIQRLRSLEMLMQEMKRNGLSNSVLFGNFRSIVQLIKSVEIK